MLIKKIFSIVISLLFSSVLLSQNSFFYSTSTFGGENDLGFIYRTDNNGNNFEKIYDFDILRFPSQHANLIFYDDKLFGTAKTSFAPSFFSIHLNSNELEKEFTNKLSINGHNFESITLGNNGKIYATASWNGYYGSAGAFVAFDIANKTLEPIHFFDFENGNGTFYDYSIELALRPNEIIAANDDNIYGTTGFGGSDSLQGAGIIFKYIPDLDSFATVARFNEFDESATGLAARNLINISDSSFIGKTGIWGNGFLFEYNFILDTLIKLTDFSDFNIDANFSLGTDGNLFAFNNSTIYKYDVELDSILVIHQFLPEDSLLGNTDDILIVNNKLFGFARKSSNANYNFFEFDLISNSLNLVSNAIPKTNESNFNFNLTKHPTENKIYVIANKGGTSELGIILEYNIDFQNLNTIYEFIGDSLGYYPNSNLHLIDNELLVGKTENSFNSYFQFNISNNQISKIKSLRNFKAFNGKYYTYCTGGICEYFIEEDSLKLIASANGNFTVTDNEIYFFNAGGFNSNFDTINSNLTKFYRNDSTYTVIYNNIPYEINSAFSPNIFLGCNGNIYCISTFGGYYNAGKIMQFDSQNGSNELTEILDFAFVDNGQFPANEVVFYNDKIYGTTQFGGYFGDGVLYSFDCLNNYYEKLHDFETAATGRNPLNNLFVAENGKLYGSTYEGGNNNFGTFYEYDLDANILNVKHHFDTLHSISNVSSSKFVEVDAAFTNFEFYNQHSKNYRLIANGSNKLIINFETQYQQIKINIYSVDAKLLNTANFENTDKINFESKLNFGNYFLEIIADDNLLAYEKVSIFEQY